MEIWSSQLEVAQSALKMARVEPKAVAAIGITNQRETTLLWDRRTGEPLHNAIVWQDRRTAEMCDELKRTGYGELIRSRAGLVIDPYFSGSKLRWLLENVPGAAERARRGGLAFGTVDTWLLWKLTGGRVHVTDPSNASRTMLFGLESRVWDEELLQVLQIPHEVLPEVRSSSEVYGQTLENLFGAPIPIAGLAGDQQAALFGQNCWRRGMAKNTYGTGCFALMNIGPKPAVSAHELLTSVAWTLGGATDYALEGSVFVAGAVVQWLRDGLGLIRSSEEIEQLAASVPDSGGIYLVPAFAGLGAPHWDPYARGIVAGISRGTRAGHLARAALEGIAFQVADVLEVMKQDSATPINELRVDGGASANNLLMQIQADLLQVPVVRPKQRETTALGAAFMAGLAIGFWGNRAELGRAWQSDRTFEPKLTGDEVAWRRERWAEAVNRSRGWEKKAESQIESPG